MRESVRRTLQGLMLALGAPLGWLGLRLVGGHSIADELSGHGGLYLYLLLPTLVVFATFAAVLGHHEDELERANKKLSEDVLTDELTGLKNLRYFRARLEEEHATSKRNGSGLSLLMIDLDHFKNVNDSHGHQVGDRLLRAVARTITSIMRGGETVARVGGEEFAVLLPGASGEEAFLAAERIRSAVAAVQLHPSSGVPITITVSIGAAASEDLGSGGTKELYRAADAALYVAKDRGRNQTVRGGDRRTLVGIDSGS